MVELNIVAPRAQTRLERSPFHKWVFPDGTSATEFYRTAMGYLLRFPGLADFEISLEGLKVTCLPAPNIMDATSEHLYLNQVLPLVLSKMGKFVFHASAIEVSDRAIAFMAQSGRGKSTLAANFAINGYRLLTDDALLLEKSDGDFQVIPGHASVRLWDDSRQQLMALDARPAPPLNFTSKMRFLLTASGGVHCTEPRPLRAVYFLGDGSAEDITFRHLSPPEVLVEWARHSFLLDVEDRAMVAGHFERIAAVANLVPCYHLDYPRRFGDLKRLLDSILAHATLESVAQ